MRNAKTECRFAAHAGAQSVPCQTDRTVRPAQSRGAKAESGQTDLQQTVQPKGLMQDRFDCEVETVVGPGRSGCPTCARFMTFEGYAPLSTPASSLNIPRHSHPIREYVQSL